MRISGSSLWLSGLIVCSGLPGVAEEPVKPSELLRRLAAVAKERSQLALAATHRYTIENDRLGKQAAVDLRLTSDGAGRPHVEILHEHGSEALRKRVVNRLVASYETALKASEVSSPWQITPDHYEFEPVPASGGEDGLCLFRVKPKQGGLGTLEGHVWVSPSDCQVVRFEGSFTRKPSLWVAKPVLRQVYRKTGNFWFLQRVDGHADSAWIGTTRFTLDVVDLVVAPSQGSRSLHNSKSHEVK